MTTIAIDYDAVIHAYTKGWHDGTLYDQPVPGAFDAIRVLQNAGHPVIILTSRHTQLEEIAAWTENKSGGTLRCTSRDPGGPFWDDTTTILVTSRKLAAAVYIDDRGYRFTTWPAALTDLQTLL